MRVSMALVGVLLGSLCHAGPCHAQWTVTSLHPAGPTDSQSFSTTGTQQVGAAFFGREAHASLWSGTAASWVDLHPGGAQSYAWGASGAQQVGWATVEGWPHASLWSGTAASWVDLNPTGSTQSQAVGTSGVQQVGGAEVGGVQRASLWSGTAASWVDLHPTSATSSFAYGIFGTHQVGFAIVGGVQRASLWNGSSASWVDLSPSGSTSSWAYCATATQQVGTASGFASLWSGSAASWVNLNPLGATASGAYGIHGTQQVGYATVGGVNRASLWTGTAASWEDLSAVLPGAWGNSYAFSIWSDTQYTYVAGYGVNHATGRDEALLWTRSNCPDPRFADQPLSTSVCSAGAVSFSVTATGTGPFTYRWQREAAPGEFVNLANGRTAWDGCGGGGIVFGSTTRSLVIAADTAGGRSLCAGHAVRYRCIVTNACGSVPSQPATLTICAADFNCDGFLDFFDYDTFVECFETEACGGGTADFNGDGFVDFFDYDDFVLAFETGC
ncbi:MAG: hypothetical protein HEQ23_12635 [Tepidisphaera sp.]